MSLEDDLRHAKDKDELHRIIDALDIDTTVVLVTNNDDRVEITAMGKCSTTEIIGTLRVASYFVEKTFTAQGS